MVVKEVQPSDLAAANKVKVMIDPAGGSAGENTVSVDKNMVVKEVQTSDLESANKLKAMIETAGGAAGSVDKNMVRVEGGALPSGSGLAGQVVATFQIGKYEVTWGEWQKVRVWAVAKGYDLKDVGQGRERSRDRCELV